MKEKIVIIGGGPAGLFCAYQLLIRNYSVDLYDQMSGVGKKFLVAGNGGLNLTHSEELSKFSAKYGKDQEFFKELLQEFSPQQLRDWCQEIDVPTFVGTSGRVFPEKLNAAEILLNWTKKLSSFPAYKLFLKHRLENITEERELIFSNGLSIKPDKVIFALGGASWEKTGSDGFWAQLFSRLGVKLEPFLPMNCGFERDWSEPFKSKVNYHPLKNISIQFGEQKVRGEAMLTPFGIEGGAVYAISNQIRNTIMKKGKASIFLDLKPDLSLEEVIVKLKQQKSKDSLKNQLRKGLGLDSGSIMTIRELSAPEKLRDVEYLASQIKRLELELSAVRPLSEAISTSGGVSFSALDSHLQILDLPGYYIAGEMLDFEAPTGGYLLQGCFSSAWRIVQGIDAGS
ncbi:MAG: TIGR03862 family flavoprotein [Halobacteriovoraceae bacterium]|jgi:uncharacterized flavoprotein (TIGR03862 family)|nr:TIGR03862 family flavoprotein [Halobacteriovoraceae bacterium]